MLQAIDGIDQCHHAIQPILRLQHGVGHQRLHHRCRIGKAGGFDHQPVKIDDLAIASLDEQIAHGLLQIAAQHTAQAAIVEQHHLLGRYLDKVVVDGLLTQFVDDHRHAVHIRPL